ncbi:hypothetical protein HPB48_026625 [Haemaphysalis longicornis]|uniref:Uncharacterized protein n=1 Tax=Haemaphysalis longicornis TaxID=44386 RepID=A0A9J6HCN3_HAELO|nr:hypothetical protein HPB48_026625 [Haemaphysalis longicornis]
MPQSGDIGVSGTTFFGAAGIATQTGASGEGGLPAGQRASHFEISVTLQVPRKTAEHPKAKKTVIGARACDGNSFRRFVSALSELLVSVRILIFVNANSALAGDTYRSQPFFKPACSPSMMNGQKNTPKRHRSASSLSVAVPFHRMLAASTGQQPAPPTEEPECQDVHVLPGPTRRGPMRRSAMLRGGPGSGRSGLEFELPWRACTAVRRANGACLPLPPGTELCKCGAVLLHESHKGSADSSPADPEPGALRPAVKEPAGVGVSTTGAPTSLLEGAVGAVFTGAALRTMEIGEEPPIIVLGDQAAEQGEPAVTVVNCGGQTLAQDTDVETAYRDLWGNSFV